MKIYRLSLLAALACLLSNTNAHAEFQLGNLFGDAMVLQQEAPIKFWGSTEPRETIEVTFAGQTKTVTADSSGKWVVEFPAMKASYDSYEVVFKDKDQEKTLRDILIGEVWICGGQSNMAAGGHYSADLEYPCADSEYVRYTFVEAKASNVPLDDISARCGWKPLVDGKMELRRIGPVSYYFGIRLQRFLKVPVGIVNAAIGGTTAEVWASPESLRKIPQLKECCAAIGDDLGAFYNGMIVPLARMSAAGVIFYQGENNTFEMYETYEHSFPCVIRDWRRAFGDDRLPFGIVSLAGNKPMTVLPEPEAEMTHRHSYTHIRDVHFRTFRSTENTGLIAIHDLGEDDMHPGCKRDVGERSARWAIAMVYGYGKIPIGQGGVYHTAPIYREYKIEGDRILLYFDYDPTIDDVRSYKTYKRLPLMRRAREFRGFVIAGEDRQFFPAEARVREVKEGQDIRGEYLEVWSEDVPRPVAVRYAWANQPNANAYGLLGIPVAPFRTDTWPFIRAEPSWASDLEQRKKENEATLRQNSEWRKRRRITELKRELRSLGVEIPKETVEE